MDSEEKTMKNTINASVEFHYRGELYAATVTVDLDQLMENQVRENSSTLPSLHNMLATKIGIDKYSYQFEMLLAEDIRFSEAQGIAVNHLLDGYFDIAGFENAWRENTMLRRLQLIATQRLNIDDIEQHPALKGALLEAYQAGSDAADGHNQ